MPERGESVFVELQKMLSIRVWLESVILVGSVINGSKPTEVMLLKNCVVKSFWCNLRRLKLKSPVIMIV